LNGAKEYQLSLRNYCKKRAPEAIDEHGNPIPEKFSEHLKKLQDAGKGPYGDAKGWDEEDWLLAESGQVGEICAKWLGSWISLLDECACPPLCESCYEKPSIQEILKRVDLNEIIYKIKK
jgi:hypothetical protein